MIDDVPSRVAEIRGVAVFLLALAFSALMIGSFCLALRTPGNEVELGSAYLAIAAAVVFAGVALWLWLKARRLDRSTMVVRGNGRRR